MTDTARLRIPPHRIILATAIVLIAIFAVLTPNPMGGTNDPELTTYAVSPQGGRGLYEVVQKLGWQVERLERAYSDTMSTRATYALLGPAIELTPSEVHVLLERVRNGASLFYVTEASSALTDSLNLIARWRAGNLLPYEGIVSSISADRSNCPVRMNLMPVGLDVPFSSFRIRDSSPRDTVTFALGASDSVRWIMGVGMKVGSGRVAALASTASLRNDVIRECGRREGVLAVRMLEWASEPVGRRLVFDEYHHGYGQAAMGMEAVRNAIVLHPLGRVLLALLAAAAVLIAALAPRAIPPRARERIERRSPFEHVGALARAYENVGATRRGTALLIRGLRRRHDAAAWRHGSDLDFINAIAKVHPQVAADAALLGDAIDRKVSPAEFIKVGEAVERIERALSSEYSHTGV